MDEQNPGHPVFVLLDGRLRDRGEVQGQHQLILVSDHDIHRAWPFGGLRRWVGMWLTRPLVSSGDRNGDLPFGVDHQAIIVLVGP